MLVRDWMSRPVVAATADDTVSTAVSRMEANRVRCLPVLEGGRLKGILTQQDLECASASVDAYAENRGLNHLLADQKIKCLMRTDPITIPLDGALDEAAFLLLEHGIQVLPVMGAKGELVGILTKGDILRAFISLTGYPGRGLQFGMQVDDVPSSVDEAVRNVWRSGGSVANLLSARDRAPERRRLLHVRAFGLSPGDKAGLKAWLLENRSVYYLIDPEANERKIMEQEQPAPDIGGNAEKPVIA